MKHCPKCGENKDLSCFYKIRNNTNLYHTYCKKCQSDNAVYRQRLFKQRCLDYKGNCCEICGYNKCYAALEFHHRDKTQKEINISTFYSFNEDVLKELDKCDLLCANCHREQHFGDYKNIIIRPSSFIPSEKSPIYCECGREKSKGAISCHKCYKPPCKAEWPPVEELIDMVNKSSYCAVARQLGVTDKAVRKRIKTRTNN